MRLEYESRLAFDIWGRGGVGMLNMIQLGRGEMERLAANAERVVGILKRTDASKVEEMNDNIMLAAKAFEEIAEELTVRIAPYVTLAAEKITNMVADSERLNSVFNSVGKVVAQITTWTARFGAGLQWIAGLTRVVHGSIVAMIGAAAEMSARLISGIADGMEGMPFLGEMSQQMRTFATSMSRVAYDIAKAGAASARAGDQMMIDAEKRMLRIVDENSVGNWIDSIAAAAEERAKAAGRAMPDAMLEGLDEVEGKIEKVLNVGQFKQGGIFTTAFGPLPDPFSAITGMRAGQSDGPKASQVDRTNSLLEILVSNTDDMVAVAG